MIRVTRRYRFAASHRLHSGRFSEDENRALYGKCNNPYGHGHDYVLDISIVGPLDIKTGLVANIQSLDKLINERILQDFDHRYLNTDVPEFQQLVPTSENILRVMKDRLADQWRLVFPGDFPRLEDIRLRETRRNYFELKAN